MVKAFEFIKYISDEVRFNFFSGVPCKELNKIYKQLDKNDLVYINAVNYNAALGLCIGSAITGTKSALLVEPTKFKYILNDLFDVDYKAPVLFITVVSEDDKKYFEGLLYMKEIDYIYIRDDYKDKIIEYFTKNEFDNHLAFIIHEEDLI